MPRGAFGDLADNATARPTRDLALSLSNAKIGGGGERPNVADDSARGSRTSQVLSSCLDRFHPRGNALADPQPLPFEIAF
jgi:hypothetical protein